MTSKFFLFYFRNKFFNLFIILFSIMSPCQLNHTYELKKFQVNLEQKDFPSGIGNVNYICLNSKSEINEIDDSIVIRIR